MLASRLLVRINISKQFARRLMGRRRGGSRGGRGLMLIVCRVRDMVENYKRVISLVGVHYI